jgi:hypothetical protein
MWLQLKHFILIYTLTERNTLESRSSFLDEAEGQCVFGFTFPCLTHFPSAAFVINELRLPSTFVTNDGFPFQDKHKHTHYMILHTHVMLFHARSYFSVCSPVTVTEDFCKFLSRWQPCSRYRPTVTQIAKKFLASYESQRPLSCSRELVTSPCNVSNKFSPQHPIQCIQDSF